MEGGIDGAFFDLEKVIGGALDVEDDAVAMKLCALGEGFENEEVETALEIVSGH
jgi:hypothetical protein